jgi:hypothetical protein
MTNSTATAPTNYNPKWEDVEFPNPSISSDKWNFDYEDAKRLEKNMSALLPFVAIVIFFALFSRFGPFSSFVAGFDSEEVGAAAFLGIFISMLIGSFFLASKLSKRMVASRNRKRDEYRATHAATIIDGLAEKGWKIVGNDAVKTVVEDFNNPYLLNENGVRYYARQFHIERENITFMVELRDEEVQKEMKDKEKQSRIEFLVNRYETANGTMTPEMKSGFVAGLNMGLRVE